MNATRAAAALRLLAVLVLVLGVTALFPVIARADDASCDGGRERPLTGEIHGNVSVPVGASCVISKAQIFGSVRVFWHASVSVYDTSIHGDFVATGASAVRFNSLGEELGNLRGRVAIDGDVIIKESRFNKTSGFGDSTFIGQDLTLKRNHATEKGVVFVMCPSSWCRGNDHLKVMGDVAIRWNQVPIEINNIHIRGDLNCRDNAGRVSAPPNETAPPIDIRVRKATGQCRELAPK